jgi:hypothetical protein
MKRSAIAEFEVQVTSSSSKSQFYDGRQLEEVQVPQANSHRQISPFLVTGTGLKFRGFVGE